MGANQKHYTKEGKEWGGNYHKMPNGQLHTNKTHTKTSVRLYHLNELPKRVRDKMKKAKV